MNTDAGRNTGPLLKMYVVYSYPSDHPKSPFVVREWQIIRDRVTPLGTDNHWHADTLDEARAKLPQGLVNIGRQVGDDRKIVEVWT